MTEEEIIRNQFASILNNLVNNKIAPTGTAILSAQQPMILLFEKLIYKINRQDTEINKLNNVIDRMAQELSNYAMDSYSCSKWCKLDDCNNWSNGYCIENDLSCIKEYFMKEDK